MNKCDTCFDTKEISTINIVDLGDGNSELEEGKSKIPCPDCCKDFYKDQVDLDLSEQNHDEQ